MKLLELRGGARDSLFGTVDGSIEGADAAHLSAAALTRLELHVGMNADTQNIVQTETDVLPWLARQIMSLAALRHLSVCHADDCFMAYSNDLFAGASALVELTALEFRGARFTNGADFEGAFRSFGQHLSGLQMISLTKCLLPAGSAWLRGLHTITLTRLQLSGCSLLEKQLAGIPRQMPARCEAMPLRVLDLADNQECGRDCTKALLTWAASVGLRCIVLPMASGPLGEHELLRAHTCSAAHCGEARAGPCMTPG